MTDDTLESAIQAFIARTDDDVKVWDVVDHFAPREYCDECGHPLTDSLDDERENIRRLVAEMTAEGKLGTGVGFTLFVPSRHKDND